jgi:hypothetical protein
MAAIEELTSNKEHLFLIKLTQISNKNYYSIEKSILNKTIISS